MRSAEGVQRRRGSSAIGRHVDRYTSQPKGSSSDGRCSSGRSRHRGPAPSAQRASETFSPNEEKELPMSSLDPSLLAWALLGVAVVVMLAIDLFVFGRGDHEVTVKESTIWSA